ncbi:hypothetical protein NAEGRDRAFT_34959 [Naegleria gruberi]|uniref:Pre-mRNA-splicing factor SLU7 n=1 Tax=Naegleria gruberi TaxID=5762 RepID=D2UZY4_NAEGR|nr:uncharacterized protein NAEGRDRAFT_34959 [Naegleria gruberi]EFC50244.1 hypothetical protein NAEGRDRAFT_34959 [Naegleria gruberi]|eukprot:XP_002682988.1 hypothetical protein NAEGRDRAFT_34959 [Naegleria gruberi strain NEG-M]
MSSSNNKSNPSASASSQRLSRDEYKKQQLIEEARKNGLVMPEKDEQGRDINPHIPQYIKQAPWYLDRGAPSLDHQRYSEKEKDEFGNWYNRGIKIQAATKYRKGACKNCGSMTHKEKECTERPRRKGAALTNSDIAPDDLIHNIQVKGFEAKRDNWNGYDSSLYAKEVVEVHQELEKERKKNKDRQLHEKMIEKQRKKEQRNQEKDNENKQNNNSDSSDDEYFSSSDSGDEDLDKSGRSGKKEVKTTSVSQSIRTREDIPKYLYNLELDSAHYDSKTRSMRGNPLPFVDPSEAPYTGDNATKKTGEYNEFIQAQKFMWDAVNRGEDINIASVPSQAFMAHSHFKQKKRELEETRKKAIVERYGGEKFLNKPQEYVTAQTENYAEYSTSGRIIGGKHQATIKSKYEEDVFYNGHTSVFGSHWDPNKGWGFRCCRQFDRKCFCNSNNNILETSTTTKEEPITINSKQNENIRKSEFSYPIQQEKKRKLETGSPYSKSNYQISEQEMEEYRKKKSHFEDPMNSLPKDY